MKRYYICDVVEEEPGTGVYVPAIEKLGLGVGYVSVMPPTPEGVPAANWCLVRVAGRDLRGLENRANVTPLPDVSLDVKLSSIRTQTYEAFQNRLAARYNVAPNVSAQGSSSHAVRDLIEGLARRLNPDFSANNFDLPDVA